MEPSFSSFPFILGWELTLECNLRCRHCGSSAGEPRPHELSTQEALAICEQLPSLLVQEVDFTGGEPLMRPDWPQITERLVGSGIPCKVLSNGLMLTEGVVSEMKAVGMSGVGVSIDGLERTHDRMRGLQGLFGQLMLGIERVLLEEIPLTVITTVTGLNIHQLPHLYETLRDAGVRRWQVQPVFSLGRVRYAHELELTADQVLDLGRFVQAYVSLAKDEGVDLLPSDSYGYYTGLDTREPPWRGCPAGLVSCGITSDGKVKGCLSLPDNLIEGDLRERDLWDIWFDEDAFSYNRHYDAKQLGDNCRDCPQAEQCQGGCSAMSYGATGQFHNDPCCFTGIAARNPALAEMLRQQGWLGREPHDRVA